MHTAKQKEFIASLKALLIRYDVEICNDDGVLFFLGTPDSSNGFEIAISVKDVMDIIDTEQE